jgi:cytochrome c556
MTFVGTFSAMRTGIAAGVMLAAASAGGIAWAGSVPVPADQLIETRQSGQDVVYGLISTMKAAVESKGDVKGFADGAGAMSRWFANFASLFPPGTETGHGTKVKPEAFSDAAGFAKAAADASAAAKALSEAAKTGDQAAFAEKFKALGGACHKAYKEKT